MKTNFALRIIAILLCLVSAASAQTRNVNISWPTSPGITGYAVLVSTVSATGPFAFKACTGTVPGQTCVTGSTASTSTYTDIETVGTTVYYEMQAYAAACTPTTPVGTACGTGSPSAVVATTIPPQPIVTSVVVSVQ
jgi:hypothetical protein